MVITLDGNRMYIGTACSPENMSIITGELFYFIDVQTLVIEITWCFNWSK